MCKLATQGNQFSGRLKHSRRDMVNIFDVPVSVYVCVCLYVWGVVVGQLKKRVRERERQRGVRILDMGKGASGASNATEVEQKDLRKNVQKTRIGLFLYSIWKMAGNWTQNLVHWVHTKIVLQIVLNRLEQR